MNTDYAWFYVEANIVCIILFAIMLFRSLRGIDKQLKQNVFNRVMIYHILYFISDIFWELVSSGILPKNRWTVTIPNLTNQIFIFCLTYYWFYYIEVSQKASYILKKRNVALTLIAGIIPIYVSVFLFIFFPKLMINPDYTLTPIYTILFISAPMVYTLIAALQSLYRAFKKENYVFRSQYIIVGFYPIMLVLFGIMQIVFLKAPIFCFGLTILMVYVYIASLDNLVSIDPLTGLNNRAQLKRFIAQEAGRSSESNQHYIIMMDLNRFKHINDTYGHTEGDKAIVKAAQAIRKACANQDFRPFISRYGGDEFLIVLRSGREEDARYIENRIRTALNAENEINDLPYTLSASFGHAPYNGNVTEFNDAVNRADEALYQDKSRSHKLETN